MTIRSIIMAGGEGKRMKSATPKTLHRLCGRSILEWALESVAQADKQPIVVVGHGRDIVMAEMSGKGLHFVVQEQQLGTGHAVMVARDAIGEADAVLVTCGDMPLIKPESVAALVDCVVNGKQDAALLFSVLQDPTGYGRIVRDGRGNIQGIVEHRDATREQRLIQEINASAYCFRKEALLDALDLLTNENAQQEYYLTDVISILAGRGGRVAGVQGDFHEGMGINDRVQLAQATTVLRDRINRAHMLGGVTIIDPATTYIDCDVSIGVDTVIYPNNVLENGSVIGAGCTLYPGSRISRTVIGDRVEVQSSVLTDTHIGDDCHIGPFAYTRPGSRIGSDVKIGDFVEIKNATVGDGTKISHLTYVGDADVGSNVNLGCGTVFVNYDGKHKHRSVVGDGAFIGCNTNLVAPVRVGENAYTAAGSTITEDVPGEALAIARARQVNKEGWVAKRNEKEGK